MSEQANRKQNQNKHDKCQQRHSMAPVADMENNEHTSMVLDRSAACIDRRRTLREMQSVCVSHTEPRGCARIRGRFTRRRSKRMEESQRPIVNKHTASVIRYSCSGKPVRSVPIERRMQRANADEVGQFAPKHRNKRPSSKRSNAASVVSSHRSVRCAECRWRSVCPACAEWPRTRTKVEHADRPLPNGRRAPAEPGCNHRQDTRRCARCHIALQCSLSACRASTTKTREKSQFASHQ
jgi:hypothetical protein